ncbi:hypothetical protein EsH8_VII_000067 [Colletotrichum jinshuiense]
MCLCNDYSEIDIHVIVSDFGEAKTFEDALSSLKACERTFSIFPVPPANIKGPKPKVNIINLYDILPPVFHSITEGNITREDTSALLNERGKFQYQTIKKMAAAAELKYDYALWLDSEAIVVQPFSIRQTFESYVKAPTIWRSRMNSNEFMRAIMDSTASVLGRSIDSFGPAFWNLESVEWIIEKPVFNDMIHEFNAVTRDSPPVFDSDLSPSPSDMDADEPEDLTVHFVGVFLRHASQWVSPGHPGDPNDPIRCLEFQNNRIRRRAALGTASYAVVDDRGLAVRFGIGRRLLFQRVAILEAKTRFYQQTEGLVSLSNREFAQMVGEALAMAMEDDG